MSDPKGVFAHRCRSFTAVALALDDYVLIRRDPTEPCHMLSVFANESCADKEIVSAITQGARIHVGCVQWLRN